MSPDFASLLVAIVFIVKNLPDDIGKTVLGVVKEVCEVFLPCKDQVEFWWFPKALVRADWTQAAATRAMVEMKKATATPSHHPNMR